MCKQSAFTDGADEELPTVSIGYGTTMRAREGGDGGAVSANKNFVVKQNLVAFSYRSARGIQHYKSLMFRELCSSRISDRGWDAYLTIG